MVLARNFQLETCNQFRETAIIADCVRVFAKIPDDLHQALLHRRRFKNACAGNSKQTLPCKFQDGIVLRRRPRKKSPLHFKANFLVAAFFCPDPQPRQNHIYRQVRHARISQERLRDFQLSRFERPVP